jgi:signal peptidase I
MRQLVGARLQQKLGGSPQNRAAKDQPDPLAACLGTLFCGGCRNGGVQSETRISSFWLKLILVDENDVTVTEQNPAVPDPPAPADTPPEPPQRSLFAEWIVTAILLLFGTTTLVQAYVIPTGSMENSLLVGDHLLVDKLAYAPSGGPGWHVLPYDDLKRGDVIVFRYPVDINQTFVKRLIGLPGDRIRLSDKQLFLNGKPVFEPYVYHGTDYIDSFRDNFPGAPNVSLVPAGLAMLRNHVVNGEVVVPPGSYFAMGDNRDFSLDSRYWGFVPRANIIGKPLLIYWSYDATTAELSDQAIGLRHLVDMVLHFPVKTRWNRTFRLIHGYQLN